MNNTAQFNAAVNDIRARKWIVGSLNENGNFSNSSCPVRHDSQESADREATRLATLNPGTAYVTLQLRSGKITPRVISVQSI